MERYSTSAVIKSMPIKTTMKYHLTLVTTAIIKKLYKRTATMENSVEIP